MTKIYITTINWFGLVIPMKLTKIKKSPSTFSTYIDKSKLSSIHDHYENLSMILRKYNTFLHKLLIHLRLLSHRTEELRVDRRWHPIQPNSSTEKSFKKSFKSYIGLRFDEVRQLYHCLDKTWTYDLNLAVFLNELVLDEYYIDNCYCSMVFLY